MGETMISEMVQTEVVARFSDGGCRRLQSCRLGDLLYMFLKKLHKHVPRNPADAIT